MQLVINQLPLYVRSLKEAATIARAAGAEGTLKDEGELIAHVSATGQVTDLDGKAVEL